MKYNYFGGYMFKRNIKIIKDYFSFVNFKNKYLITFIIVDSLNVLVSLIIPFVASLIVEYLTNGEYRFSYFLVFILGVTIFVNKLGSYITNWCYAKFFKDAYVEVHRKLVENIYTFDEEFSKKISVGKIINSSNEDIINIAEIPSFFIELPIEFIKLVVIYVIFLKENVFIMLYVISINLIYYLYARKCNNNNYLYSKRQRNYADKLMGLLSQILRGLKDIKSFGIYKQIDKKLDYLRKKWQDNYFLKRKYYFSRKAIGGFIIDDAKIFVYCLLILLLMRNKITIAIFMLFIAYYDKAKETIDEIMNFDASIIDEAVSLYRIKDIINYGNNKINYLGNINKVKEVNKIIFEDVTFKYNKKKILKNVSFEIEKNHITTIVGKSGVGKTTIFNLLLRLYTPNKGNIYFDDINILEYTKNIYNKMISIVNQKTFVFNMSISDNLALIDSNKENQINACKKVGIHDFIMTLPKGYNTILKEDAINISGGQKQLLSLARALLTNAKILLLDEVTSALDPLTTKKIMNLIQSLKKDYTIIVITHNKDFMKISDKIVLMDKGKIAGIGTHKTLIKNNKLYNYVHK